MNYTICQNKTPVFDRALCPSSILCTISKHSFSMLCVHTEKNTKLSVFKIFCMHTKTKHLSFECGADGN